jgi:hypothetical protein
MEKHDGKKTIAVLASLWDAKPMNAVKGEYYLTALLPLDYHVVDAAIRRLAATHKYPTMPSLNEILEAANDIANGPQRDPMEAWGDVVDAIHREGYCGSPSRVINDPLVLECVDSMGWLELCKSENDAADRARFCDLYAAKTATVKAVELTGQRLPERAHGLRENRPRLLRALPGERQIGETELKALTQCAQ